MKGVNLGAYNETFNVTFSYNKTAMQWEFIGNYSFTLGLLETKTMSFLESPEWDTEYVEPSNYTIRAEVPAVPDEVDTDDNTWTSTLWRIEVIPEFPTLMPLLLVLAVLAVSTIVLMRRTSNNRLTRRLR